MDQSLCSQGWGAAAPVGYACKSSTNWALWVLIIIIIIVILWWLVGQNLQNILPFGPGPYVGPTAGAARLAASAPALVFGAIAPAHDAHEEEDDQ